MRGDGVEDHLDRLQARIAIGGRLVPTAALIEEHGGMVAGSGEFDEGDPTTRLGKDCRAGQTGS